MKRILAAAGLADKVTDTRSATLRQLIQLAIEVWRKENCRFLAELHIWIRISISSAGPLTKGFTGLHGGCQHQGQLCVLDIYPQRIYYSSMAEKLTAQAPLTPAVLHILLALSQGERHGYGIMKQVEADSQGRVSMGPGTLYGSIKRMLEAGLIRESDKRVDPEMDDERRIYYEITGAEIGRAHV